ncbi:hypothetical protein [Sorangium sp. So ce363]|uniref:hypothetical protein n=1 Tax=Sorangium sp. So ce363 TaxID=3133304 RepID=UPI003F60099C
MPNLNALIVPSDHPPRRSTIKRHLLFFDSVLLSDPSDAALINNFEVKETFRNGMEVQWTLRVPFPRSSEYEDSLRELLRETKPLQAHGKIRVLMPSTPKLDLGLNWTTYSTAITNESLVRAAIPDYRPGPPPVRLASGVYHGFSMAPPGERSKYHVETKQPAEVAGIEDNGWTGLSYARIGRTIKYIRRATAENAHPCTSDEPTTNILLTLGASASTSPLSADDVADLAIATDVVDGAELERVLVDVPWDDVLKIRRQILPHVSKLREVLRRNVRIAQQASNTGIAAYRQEINKLRSDFAKEKENVAAEWSKLKLVGASKALGVGGVVAGGLSTVVIPTTISEMLLTLISSGLAAAGAAANEFNSYIVARDKARANPMFFFDSLPKKLSSKEEL